MNKDFLVKTLSKANRFVKKNSGTILTVTGLLGFAGTIISVMDATPKALLILDKAKKEDYTPAETIAAVAPVIITPTLMAIGSASCFIGANIVHTRRQASLVGAYTMLDASFKEYRNKTKDILGEDKEFEIRQLIANDKPVEVVNEHEGEMLFYDEVSSRYFWEKLETVLLAEQELNRQFILQGYVSLNFFYQCLGISDTGYGDEIGWNTIKGEEFYGYQYIDFNHRKATRDDGQEYHIISFPFGPHAGYLDYYDDYDYEL